MMEGEPMIHSREDHLIVAKLLKAGDRKKATSENTIVWCAIRLLCFAVACEGSWTGHRDEKLTQVQFIWIRSAVLGFFPRALTLCCLTGVGGDDICSATSRPTQYRIDFRFDVTFFEAAVEKFRGAFPFIRRQEDYDRRL
jgi:hypothetical protein